MRCRSFILPLVSLLFVFCGKGEAPSKEKRVRVTFWHAMGGPLGDALEVLIQEFERDNPGIDIQAVSMANYSSLSQKLMGAVQVNAPPNIAQMYESWTTQFYHLNKLIPLDSLVKGPDGLSPGELADFFPAFIEDNTWDGKLVTLPFNKSIPVFFYNIELLKNAGYDTFPKTWEELRTMLKRVTDRKKGRYGAAGLINEGVFGTLLLQAGGTFINEEEKKALFNSEAGVSAARFLADLVNRDSTVYYGAGYEPQNDFCAGRIACIQSTSVSWAFLKPLVTFRVGVAPLPVTGRPAVLGYGTNIGIFRTGTPEQIRAAWRFIKWFTSPETQAKWAARTGYVPVRRSALALPEYQKFKQEIPGWDETLKQLEYLNFEPRSEAWFAGRRALGDALERIVRADAALPEGRGAGNTPVKTALDYAAQVVEKELNR